MSKSGMNLFSCSRQKFLVFFSVPFLLFGHVAFVQAHGGGAVLDHDGISRTFTGVATVSCVNEGGVVTEKLVAKIRDNSPPVPGLLVNLHLFKGNKAVGISDTISGDADYSPPIELHGGPGTYVMIVSKTDEGERSFDLEWHCEAADGTHTGTEIGVTQFGEPQ